MYLVLVHYCVNCHYNTPVETSATAWIQEHICSHCGHRATGADVAGQDRGTMNQCQQDELATMFAQLSTQQQLPREVPIAQDQPPQYGGQAPATVEQVSMTPGKTDAPLTFMSAHYTQSAHIRSDTQSEPSRSPPPTYYEALLPEALAETLRQNNIDPAALLPNQTELFIHADYEQRVRLLELWRIAPPSYPHEQWLQSQTAPTSVAQEEAEAKARYERQMRARTVAREEHDLDTHIPRATAARTGAASGSLALEKMESAEPYIVSGYEQHTDPVYAALGRWQTPSYAQVQQQQEDQYGMYEQLRNHADWERMNEQAMRERMSSQAMLERAAEDDDMAM